MKLKIYLALQRTVLMLDVELVASKDIGLAINHADEVDAFALMRDTGLQGCDVYMQQTVLCSHKNLIGGRTADGLGNKWVAGVIIAAIRIDRLQSRIGISKIERVHTLTGGSKKQPVFFHNVVNGIMLTLLRNGIFGKASGAIAGYLPFGKTGIAYCYPTDTLIAVALLGVHLVDSVATHLVLASIAVVREDNFSKLGAYPHDRVSLGRY